MSSEGRRNIFENQNSEAMRGGKPSLRNEDKWNCASKPLWHILKIALQHTCNAETNILNKNIPFHLYLLWRCQLSACVCVYSVLYIEQKPVTLTKRSSNAVVGISNLC